MPKRCYLCERENTEDQAFCGGCGSALSLNDFISKKVQDELAVAIRDRDVIETESSIKIFERAWGWVKIVGGIAAVLFAIVGATVYSKVYDLRSTVEQAKQSVDSTAATARAAIAGSSSSSLQEIEGASKGAKQASEKASAEATKQAAELRQSSVQTKAELSRQAASVKTEVERSHTALQAASKLQPEMAAMSEQLAQATAQMQAQQKVISSSEEFVKQVFSSHVQQVFNLSLTPNARYVVVPPPKGSDRTAVFLLLDSTPIPGTVQLVWHVFAQQPTTYFNVHNVFIFFWGEPSANLIQHQLSVSYFPDKSDKDIAHSLSEQDGRVFADGEPFPKFNQPDPDFFKKGSKWFPLAQPQ